MKAKQTTQAGQFEVGQRVEYVGKHFDFPTRTTERFTVKGEITGFRRGAEDRNAVIVTILAAEGEMHHARALFHPLGNLRLQDGESIRVLSRAPRQQEISA